MEQVQQGARPSPMDRDLAEMFSRVVRLETAAEYRDSIWSRDMSLLHQRLKFLETRPPRLIITNTPVHQALGVEGWVKIVGAIILPLLVLYSTGSLERAVEVGRIIGGP